MAKATEGVEKIAAHIPKDIWAKICETEYRSNWEIARKKTLGKSTIVTRALIELLQLKGKLPKEGK